LQPFVPLFKNPHVQTIAAHFWPRPSGTRRHPVEKKLYHTEPEVQVLVETERPAGAPRGEIVLVHGLEGSADAGYMHSMAACAVTAGYTVHRLNLRSCGGTERLARTVYHGGHLGFLAKGRPRLWLDSRHNGMDKGSRNKAPPYLVWILNENQRFFWRGCHRRGALPAR
jgi:predicted alpha/beta-fold hydrolase